MFSLRFRTHEMSSSEVPDTSRPPQADLARRADAGFVRAAKARAQKPRRPRWIPYALGAILILAILAGLRPQPAPVETARVKTGSLRATVDEEGRTRIRHRYVVSAPVAGQLRRIPFKAGAAVEVGKTILAVIDPLPPTPLDARTRSLAEARRDAAAANVEKARTAHQFALKDLHRFQRLFKENTVSQQELESFQWREVAAAKELAAAESALREAEAELAEIEPMPTGNGQNAGGPLEVLSPANGRVLRVIEENSRVIPAGAPLLEVGDPGELEVVVEVLSRDGAVIEPGAEALLDQWGSKEPLRAKVRLVEPAAFTKVSALGVEEQRVNVIADLLTPPEQRLSLGDQFRVEAHIALWEVDNVLKTPSGALFRRGPEWAAFVVEEGRARLRLVKVGRANATEMEILDGLREGEEVILFPGDRITDGQRVKPITITVGPTK